MKQNRKSLFISIEGVDCTGKTTVSQALCQLLHAQYFHGPAEPLGSAIAQLPPSSDRVLEYFLHRAAIQNDSSIIARMLTEGHVVADRYIHSVRAYFTASEPQLASIAEKIGITVPNATFLLVASPDVRHIRLAQRNGIGARESNEEFQLRADALFRRQGHTTIDTSEREVSETAKKIYRWLKIRFFRSL